MFCETRISYDNEMPWKLSIVYTIFSPFTHWMLVQNTGKSTGNICRVDWMNKTSQIHCQAVLSLIFIFFLHHHFLLKFNRRSKTHWAYTLWRWKICFIRLGLIWVFVLACCWRFSRPVSVNNWDERSELCRHSSVEGVRRAQILHTGSHCGTQPGIIWILPVEKQVKARCSKTNAMHL